MNLRQEMKLKRLNRVDTSKRLKAEGDSLIKKIHAMIEEYSLGIGLDFEGTLTHAMTDIRHICDHHGLDYSRMDRVARDGYLQELSLLEAK